MGTQRSKVEVKQQFGAKLGVAPRSPEVPVSGLHSGHSMDLT